MKKLNFLCGPARCLKLVIWPTEKKILHTPGLEQYGRRQNLEIYGIPFA